MMNVRIGDQTEAGFGLVGVDRQGIDAEQVHRDLLRASPAASEVKDRQVLTKSGPCQGTKLSRRKMRPPHPHPTTRASRPAPSLKHVDAADVRRVRGYFEVSGK